jgi:hypothetical protein
MAMLVTGHLGLFDNHNGCEPCHWNSLLAPDITVAMALLEIAVSLQDLFKFNFTHCEQRARISAAMEVIRCRGLHVSVWWRLHYQVWL